MLNIDVRERWPLAEVVVDHYLSTTPVVIGAPSKRKVHAKDYVMTYRPDYQPRTPKLRSTSRISIRRYQYTQPTVTIQHGDGRGPYYKHEWSCLFWIKHHKRLHKVRKHAKRFSLYSLDMAGVVCAPFPPGFFGDNPATATGLLGDAAVLILKLGSTAQEQGNMAAADAELKKMTLLKDPMASFLRVRAVGVMRPSRSQRGTVRSFNYGMLEICQMSRPAMAYASMAGLKAILYANVFSTQLPRKAWQIDFANNTKVTAGGSEGEIFSAGRYRHHNQFWY